MDEKTLIPVRRTTKYRLRTICIDEGRTYDGLILELLDLYGR